MLLEATDPANTQRLFGKVDASDADWPPRVYGIYRSLEDAAHDPGARGQPPIAPRPIAYDVDPPSICYEWIEGDTVHDRFRAATTGSMRPPEELLGVADVIGRALCTLHDTWTTGESDRDPADAAQRPGPPRRLRVLARLSGGRVEAADPPVRSPADLGPWNLLITARGVVFIDLDDGGRRAPELDVGLLCDRMRATAFKWVCKEGHVRERDGAAFARTLAESMVDGYRDRAGELGRAAIDVRTVHAAAAAEAVTSAALRVRHLRTWKGLRSVIRSAGWACEHVLCARRSPRGSQSFRLLGSDHRREWDESARGGDDVS